MAAAQAAVPDLAAVKPGSHSCPSSDRPQVHEGKAWCCACNGRSSWCKAGSSHMNAAYPAATFPRWDWSPCWQRSTSMPEHHPESAFLPEARVNRVDEALVFETLAGVASPLTVRRRWATEFFPAPGFTVALEGFQFVANALRDSSSLSMDHRIPRLHGDVAVEHAVCFSLT